MSAQQHSPSRETSAAVALWLGLLGLVVLWFFALIFHGPMMERRIGQAVSDRLVEAGFQRIVVETRGRDILLAGDVSGNGAKRVALALARDVPGVRVVRDRMHLIEAQLPWLRVRRQDSGDWQVSGVLPDQSVWDEVTQLFEERISDQYTLQSRTDPETGDPDWIATAGELLSLVAELEQCSLEIGAGFVEVGGIMTDVARHNVLQKALDQIAGAAAITVINRIALLPPKRTQTPEKSAN